MRNELQHIEKIEQYLTGSLTETETIAFEKEISENPSLEQQVATQKLLQHAALRKALRADVMKYGGAGGGFAWGKWISIITGVILIGGLVWYFNNKEASESQYSHSSTEITTIDTLQNETLADQIITVQHQDSTSEKESSSVNDSISSGIIAKHNPPSKVKIYEEDTPCDGLKTWVKPDIQEYTINPKQGETIEGKDGTLIIVPTDAFLYEDGSLVSEEVKLELVEALKVSDMLAYNLTTMNGDNPLQTGGMIYVQPYANGKKVTINSERPLYIEIPTDDYNPAMMAWQGQVDEKGDINWESPTPLKKYLTLVDFDNLDFLPAGFEDAVTAGMPFKGHTVTDKALVDSLYYSLGTENNSLENADCNTYDEANSFADYKVTEGANNASITLVLLDTNYNKIKNATCEIRFRNVSLKSKTSDENGRVNFDKVRNGTYQLKVCNGDKVVYLNDFKIKKGANPITTIFPFLNPTKNIEGNWNKVVQYKLQEIEDASSTKSNTCYISPQSIQTIKSATFAKSFLATKEFEERLKVLHQIPNAQELFDLYVNNLEKDLSEVDAMVAAKLSGNDKKYFEDFAAQKLTNVLNVNIYQEQLSKYYNNKKRDYIQAQKEAQLAYNKSSTKELKEYQQKLNKLVAEYNQAGNTQSLSSSSSVSSTSTIIAKPRSSKLNISLPVRNNKLPQNNNVVTSRNSYATPWYGTGWMNIDAYLHLISKDPKEVGIEIGKDNGNKGAKVYQFLNTLKTIIPITIIGTIGKAKFPKAGTQGSAEMKNTYAIGINKRDGKIFYAEERYNPYSLSQVEMKWKEVSEEMLIENLRKMDGATPLIKEINSQNKLIEQQLKIQEKKAELQVEMDTIKKNMAIIEKELAKENAYIKSLEKVVNSCGVETKVAAKKVSDKVVGAEFGKLNDVGVIFEVAEVMPEFAGGMQALYDYLGKEVKYPQEAMDKNIQGKVYVQFTVYEDGSLKDVIVIKGIHPLLDEEAKRAVENMPNWKPGKELNKPVKVRFTLPISFNTN